MGIKKIKNKGSPYPGGQMLYKERNKRGLESNRDQTEDHAFDPESGVEDLGWRMV